MSFTISLQYFGYLLKTIFRRVKAKYNSKLVEQSKLTATRTHATMFSRHWHISVYLYITIVYMVDASYLMTG